MEAGAPALNREGKVFLLIGPPGAGKSTIAGPLAVEHGAYEIDSDAAKVRIPEWSSMGTSPVHVESTDIVEKARTDALRRGDNIILPVLGRDKQKLQKFVEQLQAANHEVHLILADIPHEQASHRAVTRWLEVDRLVDPLYIQNEVRDLPQQTYEGLKTHPGLASARRYDLTGPRDTPLADRLRELRQNDGAEQSSRSGRRDDGLDAQVDREGRPVQTGAEASRVEPREVPPSARGRATSVLFPDGSEVKARYHVVEAASLEPSHNPTSFEKNPRYPEGRAAAGVPRRAGQGSARPRRSHRRRSSTRGFSSTRPRVRTVQPITTPRPNGDRRERARSWRRCARRVHAPERFATVRERAASSVSQRPLRDMTPASFAHMEHPVLVRRLEDDGVDFGESRERSASLNRLTDQDTRKSKEAVSEGGTRAQSVEGCGRAA
jgi:predicted kinase